MIEQLLERIRREIRADQLPEDHLLVRRADQLDQMLKAFRFGHVTEIVMLESYVAAKTAWYRYVQEVMPGGNSSSGKIVRDDANKS